MNKREQTKLRVQRYRDKRKSVTQEGECNARDVTQYPPIIHALADPERRGKLGKICESLKTFKQGKNVYYGCGRHSIPFDIVGEYLEATR